MPHAARIGGHGPDRAPDDGAATRRRAVRAAPGLTTAAWVFLGVAAAVALVDWVAVAGRRHRLEYLCKPLTLGLLLGVGLALTPVDGLRRGYFVAALALSLAGDVLLMLPGVERPLDAGRRPPLGGVDPFPIGLGCFLVAHLDYIAGFRVGGPGLTHVAAGLLLVAPVAVPLGTVVARALRHRGEAALQLPVIAYIAVLSTMCASAVATGELLATAGAWLFVLSDATLAWNRFLRPFRWAPVVVVVTYHAAQALLVTSLVR